MSQLALTVKCRSTRGIVAAISQYLADAGCNLTDSAQFDDQETGDFFMRLSFISETGASVDGLTNGFQDIAALFGMEFQFYDESERMKVILMVSRFGHCLNDLLYRWSIGALRVDIVGVISNHEDFKDVTESHGLPYYHIPVTKETKAAAEAEQMRIVQETGAELVVLARYMQILSDGMCQKMSGRIINIHHSFLPSFKGAHP